MEAMYCARYAYAAAVLDGYFYVAGGTGSHHTILNTVEFYDPKNDDWTQVSGMNIPRRDFALVESNGFLYAMGNNEILERYDPRQDLWTVVRIQFARWPVEMSFIHVPFCHISDCLFR